MAPTGILAQQHYRSFTDLLAAEGSGILGRDEIRLLVGDTPEAEKEAIRNGLADGSIKIVIGTHAVIEGPVQFKDLQMAVIDEQHRFGVEQRVGAAFQGNQSASAGDDSHANPTLAGTDALWRPGPIHHG